MNDTIIYNVGKVVLCDLARLLGDMAAGKVGNKWVLPWNLDPYACPMNWLTGRCYSGLNAVKLDGCGTEFLTLPQIRNLQRRKKYQHIRLRDDSPAFTVRYYNAVGPAAISLHYQVYSLDDIHGLEVRRHGKIYQHTPTEAERRLETTLQSYFRHNGIVVCHVKRSVCRYYDEHKRIDIPHPRYFRTNAEYLSSLAHEAIHSTAGRMGRELVDDHDSPEYAAEELAAECGAAILLTIFNVSNDAIRRNHAAYLRCWLGRQGDLASSLDKAMDTAMVAAALIYKNIIRTRQK